MKICEWIPEYTVGIHVLDEHHQELFEILNTLFSLMADGSEDKPILRVLRELMDYTHYHFEEEEKMMVKMSYPDLDAHRKSHQKLIQLMKDYYAEASQEGMAIFVAVKVANVGLEWLKNHILKEDHLYYVYMKKQNFQF
jgi:hemerythrin-like metal-binding protein